MSILYKLIYKQRDLNNLEVVVSVTSQIQVSHFYPSFSSQYETIVTLSIDYSEAK